MVFGNGGGYQMKFCWKCLAILPVTRRYKEGPNNCDCDSGAKESILECLVCTRCLNPIVTPEGNYELE